MLEAVTKGAADIEYRDVQKPEIADNELLLEVMRIGICGSDITILHGQHKYMTFPVVQGHEASARVTQVGKSVQGFSVGDRVTVEPLVFCGTCRPCRDGNYNVCESLKVLGVHQDGMGAQFFAVDAAKVLKLAPGTSYDRGALVEPTAVATASIRRAGDLNGRNVVVLGAGPIGNLVAQVARHSGAAAVMITDIQESRLQRARECGIDHTANMRDGKLLDAVLDAFGPDKADVILDCAGVKSTIEQAIEAARAGTRIVMVANVKDPITLMIPALQRREIDFVGVFVYRREDFQRAVDLIDSGKINSEQLITNHFPLDRFHEALKYIDNNQSEVMKVLLDVNGE